MDNLDLQIIRLLARDCRNPYGNIASIVGMSPNAANGVIRSFVLRINPAILGYEKESIIVLRDIDKTAKEQDIINKIHLLGDIRVYAKQLEGVSIFALAVRAGTEDKMGISSVNLRSYSFFINADYSLY